MEMVKNCIEHTDFLTLPNTGFTFNVKDCLLWIRSNGFKRVCLQFPDNLLADASHVAKHLQQELQQQLYILGDTTYESCCIDYIAAAHVQGDAIVHFGPRCGSIALGSIPHLDIYDYHKLDSDALKEAVTAMFDNSTNISIILDNSYINLVDMLHDVFSSYPNIKIFKVTNLNNSENEVVIYVGESNRMLENVRFILKDCDFYWYDPTSEKPQLISYALNVKTLKRRNFLIDKIKSGHTIGIVVGTLAVKDYLKVVQRMKHLIEAHKKKFYIISVGKPTVAKLANFPEIDVFVFISCMANTVYENREFYKPIATPFDVEVALNPEAANLGFSYDYNSYLLVNDVAEVNVLKDNEDSSSNTAIAVKNDGTVALDHHFGAGYLAQRSWKGLQQNLGESEVKLVEEGRKGIAFGYESEPI